MDPLLLLLFLFAIAGSSDAAWCVCKSDASSTNLQKALDYACGAGADCNPIHQNGPCYNPNTVLVHCSYAANSYYQRNAQNQQACDFAGTAQLTQSDPSPEPGCTFPATPSAAGTPSTTPSTTPTTPGAPTTPSTTPGAPTTPSTPTFTPTTPGSFNTTPIGGGGGTTFDPNAPPGGSSSFGLGPSSNVGFDGSHATTNFNPHPKTVCLLLVLALALFTN